MDESKKTGRNVVEKLDHMKSATESSKDKPASPGHSGLSKSQSLKQRKRHKEPLTQSGRNQSMSCSSYFAEDQATSPYMKDRVLTENAKKLTPEQMHALEIDIFKPLDFYEILFDRMKARDNGEVEEEHGTFTVMDFKDFIAQMNEP